MHPLVQKTPKAGGWQEPPVIAEPGQRVTVGTMILAVFVGQDFIHWLNRHSGGSQVAALLKGPYHQGGLAGPFIQVLVQILHPLGCLLRAPRLIEYPLQSLSITSSVLFPW